MNPVSKPLWQRFLVFLVPLMAANILQSLSGTINNIYIGQMIGVDALAAVSVFFPIMIFLISFIIGLSSGATILIGQAWGARNVDKVKEVAGTTLTATFLMGLVVALIGIFFTDDIMKVLGAPANILARPPLMARVLLIGMPGLFIFLMVTSVLRGVGDTVTPLLSLIMSLAVGLVVTPALIQGWFGLPQIGIMAAAAATIAGFTLVLIFLFFYMRARKHPIAPDAVLARYLRIDPQLFLLVLKLGIPAGVQMVVSSISAIVVVGLVNGYGSDATAAYGAINQVLSYVQFPAMSIAIATSIFGAQAIGAGQASQLGAITRTGLLMNLCLTGGLRDHRLCVLRASGGAVHHRSGGDRDDPAIAAYRVVERGAVRRCLGAVGHDARQRHGAGADADFAGLHHPGRSAGRRSISATSWASMASGSATPCRSRRCWCCRRRYFWFFWRKKTITALV